MTTISVWNKKTHRILSWIDRQTDAFLCSDVTIRIRQSTSFLCERAILWYHRRAQEIRKEQKQMKKKIAFFDIDGTLIDMERKKMSDRMVATLHQLQRQGMRICIATGRSPLTLPSFQGVEFDAYLTFNGSYCYDASGVLYHHPIPESDVQTIIANATRIHRPVALATADRLAANGKDPDLVDYFAIAKARVEVAADFDQVAEQEVYQIMMGCRKEDYDAVLQDVRHAKIAAWWDRAVDIIPADGGKGNAIERILERYGLSREDAIAFGDGDNDIEMMEAVSVGVAMANASKRLKAVADMCCPSVREDGISRFCEEHLF